MIKLIELIYYSANSERKLVIKHKTLVPELQFLGTNINMYVKGKGR